MRGCRRAKRSLIVDLYGTRWSRSMAWGLVVTRARRKGVHRAGPIQGVG